jgi:hypothetical protein
MVGSGKRAPSSGCYETLALNKVKERCSGVGAPFFLMESRFLFMQDLVLSAGLAWGCSVSEFFYEFSATEHVDHSF